MERIHQMHVIPDVVPDFHPSFDLRASFPEQQLKATSTMPKYKFVEPGIYLLPEQVSFLAASRGHRFSEQKQDHRHTQAPQRCFPHGRASIHLDYD